MIGFEKRAGGPQHRDLLGEAQGFANQATIHVPSRQVGALAVGRRLARGVESFRIAINHSNIDPGKMSLVIMLLDHLGILPRLIGLFASGRTSPSAIGRDVSIDFHQRFSMTAPAIGHQRRGTILMGASLFDLGPHIDRGFGFILSQPPSDPQPGARFDQGTPPIFPFIIGLSLLVFFPFRPTYVHSPSIWAGPIR